MGIIKTIRMGGRGVFCEQQSSFDDCAIANFIFGPNGSGKSTLSNFLKDQSGLNSQMTDLEWDGEPSEIVVYNKEWREANFHDSRNFPGVFTLGADSVEAQKKLDELQNKLQRTKDKIDSANRQLEDKQGSIDSEMESFRNSVWDNIFKPNEEALGPALTGYRGSRSKFATKLLEESGEEPSVTIDELKTQIADVFSAEPTTYDCIDVELFRKLVDDLMSYETNSIWRLAITGNQDVDIAALIGSLGSSDWVRQGMSYLNDSDICPFCQQHTITSELAQQFEQFFDDQYEINLREAKSSLKGYRIASDELIMQAGLLASCAYMTNCNIQLQQKLKTIIAGLRSEIESTIKAMENKVAEPSRRIEITSLAPLYDELLREIISASKAIEEHNEAMLDISKEKDRLILETWATLRKLGAAAIQSHKSTIRKLESAKKGFEKTITDQKAFEDSFGKQIIEVRKAITSIQPTVDEINTSLSAYGFDGFSIQSSDVTENTYQIVRPDGKPAGKTLSEGEETFVAFLYFMQLVKGSIDPDRFSHEKIVVIDDPICSLDSTVLYIVSCMVKQLIDDAKRNIGEVKQVFVLTHNAYFHKEASFSKGKAHGDASTKYWTIQKHGNQSSVKDHGRTNPIMTSYELLWEEIKDQSTSAVALQNSMRRIVENYFRMLGQDKSDLIEKRFETVEEKIICRSLFAWMNDGSHSIPDDLYIDSYSESPDKYRQVFRRVFEVSENIEHYKMMMGETTT